ncbi:MAG: PaaI family thioesterase [Burkholderiales bacterium]
MDEQEVTRDYLARGWSVFTDPGFISHAGPFFYRMDGDGPAFAFPTFARHVNRNGVLQGGALMTFTDRACGATARHLTQSPATATVTLNIQFVDAVKIGETVTAAPSMTRATKQLIFMHGVFRVESRIVAVVDGIWKKILKAG